MRILLSTAIALTLAATGVAQTQPSTSTQPGNGQQGNGQQGKGQEGNVQSPLFNPPLGNPLGLGNPAAQSGVTPPAAPEITTPFFDDGRFPTYEAGVLPPAYANFVLRRQLYQSGQKMLGQTVRDMRLELESSEAFNDAQTRATEAHRKLMQARADAIAPLMDDDEYLTLIELQDRIGRQIADASAQTSPDYAAIRGKADLKLQYARAQRERERQYLEGNQPIASALEEVRAAGQALADLEQAFRNEVRSDESLAQLRQTIEWMRVDRAVAGAYYRKAREVAREALIFNKHKAFRTDSHSNFIAPYGYGGYGYGGYDDYGAYGTTTVGSGVRVRN